MTTVCAQRDTGADTRQGRLDATGQCILFGSSHPQPTDGSSFLASLPCARCSTLVSRRCCPQSCAFENRHSSERLRAACYCLSFSNAALEAANYHSETSTKVCIVCQVKSWCAHGLLMTKVAHFSRKKEKKGPSVPESAQKHRCAPQGDCLKKSP
jgi:hypothetical protein